MPDDLQHTSTKIRSRSAVRHDRRRTALPGRARRSAHSAKPEAFLDIVESVSPGPRVEMFARRARLGWDTWGNESLGQASLDLEGSPA